MRLGLVYDVTYSRRHRTRFDHLLAALLDWRDATSEIDGTRPLITYQRVVANAVLRQELDRYLSHRARRWWRRR